MTKISNTGSGGIRPPGSDSVENLKQSVAPNEAVPLKPGGVNSESVGPKEATGDKYAAGDLKSAGERVKSQLDSKLAPKSKEVPAQPHPGFAPPYVPVGPVVMGDNLAIPGGGSAISGETKQMNLKPDQFQINDRGILEITNEKLIEYFKSLKERAAGGDINIGITNLKPPDKE
jgi:hypothetical protein